MTEVSNKLYPSNASFCNYYPQVVLTDMAYLSQNVYHAPEDLKILGRRPYVANRLDAIRDAIDANKKGWYQIHTSDVKRPTPAHFYADLYVKLNQHRKIFAIVIAVRGTNDHGSSLN